MGYLSKKKEQKKNSKKQRGISKLRKYFRDEDRYERSDRYGRKTERQEQITQKIDV